MQRNTFGILCAVAAVVFLTCQDMLIKTLSTVYPLHEIVLVRAVVALGITIGFVHFEGGFHLLKTERPFLHVARGLLVVLANSLFFLGVAAMPIGEATAVFFLAPMLMAALSMPILKERVGPWRWGAVVVGLVGCLLIMRPGADSFQIAALLPFGAAFAYALLQIATRHLGATDRASSMAFYIQLTFLTVSLLFAIVIGDGRYAGGGGVSLEFLLRAWSWPDREAALTMVAIGGLNAVGGYLLALAYRSGAVAVVSPFEYVSLPLALFWGVMVWGDLPDALALSGIALIFAGGLVVLLREHRSGMQNTR